MEKEEGKSPKYKKLLEIDSNHRLDAVLDGGELEATFEKYLVRQLCVENLYYCRRVEEYRKIEEPVQRFVAAQAIYAEFIHSESSTEINLPISAKRAIDEKLSQARLSQHDLDPELFTESMAKVRHMMYFDSVMSFMNSPEFVAYELSKEKEQKDLEKKKGKIHFGALARHLPHAITADESERNDRGEKGEKNAEASILDSPRDDRRERKSLRYRSVSSDSEKSSKTKEKKPKEKRLSKNSLNLQNMTLNVALKNILYMSEEIEKDTVNCEYDAERISFLLTYIASFKYLIEPHGGHPVMDVDKVHAHMDETVMKAYAEPQPDRRDQPSPLARIPAWASSSTPLPSEQPSASSHATTAPLSISTTTASSTAPTKPDTPEPSASPTPHATHIAAIANMANSSANHSPPTASLPSISLPPSTRYHVQHKRVPIRPSASPSVSPIVSPREMATAENL